MKSTILATLILLVAVSAFAQEPPVTIRIKEKVLLTAVPWAAGNVPTTFPPGTMMTWSVEGGDQSATIQIGTAPETAWVIPVRTGVYVVTASATIQGMPYIASKTVIVTDEPVVKITLTAGAPVLK